LLGIKKFTRIIRHSSFPFPVTWFSIGRWWQQPNGIGRREYKGRTAWSDNAASLAFLALLELTHEEAERQVCGRWNATNAS
jgi:hypothetical protein